MFLAFDVFFVVFCVALACVIGIAVCCCLPCIIAILYAVADQEGASEEDIRALPLFKFRLSGGDKEGASEAGVLTPQNGGEERKVSADNAVSELFPEGIQHCKVLYTLNEIFVNQILLTLSTSFISLLVSVL